MSREISSPLPFTNARVTVEGTLFNGRRAKLVIPSILFSSPEAVIFTDTEEEEEIRGDDRYLNSVSYHTFKLELEGRPIRKDPGDNYFSFTIEEENNE